MRLRICQSCGCVSNDAYCCDKPTLAQVYGRPEKLKAQQDAQMRLPLRLPERKQR